VLGLVQEHSQTFRENNSFLDFFMGTLHIRIWKTLDGSAFFSLLVSEALVLLAALGNR
jgi:hypothetical protein